MSLRALAPETCPNCGHDPTGDTEEFTSGGGWLHDLSVSDGIWEETFRCPTCGETVARKRQNTNARDEFESRP